MKLPTCSPGLAVPEFSLVLPLFRRSPVSKHGCWKFKSSTTISFLWIGIRNNGKRFYCCYREPLLLILKANLVFYSGILDSTSSLGSRLTIQVSIVCGGISVATSPTSSLRFCCSSVSLKKDALLALFRSKLQQRLTHPYTLRSVEWWMSTCVNERMLHVGKRSIPRGKKEKKDSGLELPFT